MRKKNRSFLLMSLISVSLLVSVFTIVQAQSPAATAAKATKWSDPATWPDRKVPVAGDKVTIDAGKEVVLDVSPPALGGVTINGKLSFADNCRPRTDHRVDHVARGVGDWHRKPGPTRAKRPSPSPTTSKTKTSVFRSGWSE